MTFVLGDMGTERKSEQHGETMLGEERPFAATTSAAAAIPTASQHSIGPSSEKAIRNVADNVEVRLTEVMPGRLSFLVHGNAGDYVGKTDSEMEDFLSGGSDLPGCHHFTSSLHYGKVRASCWHQTFAACNPPANPPLPVTTQIGSRRRHRFAAVASSQRCWPVQRPATSTLPLPLPHHQHPIAILLLVLPLIIPIPILLHSIVTTTNFSTQGPSSFLALACADLDPVRVRVQDSDREDAIEGGSPRQAPGVLHRMLPPPRRNVSSRCIV